MTGEDISSAELAEPPRAPLRRAELDASLGSLEDSLARRAQAMGLRRWFWGEGVCLMALLHAAASRGAPAPPLVVAYVDAHCAAPPVLEHVNNLAPGAVVADLYRQRPESGYVRLLEACLDWYRAAPQATRAPNGALEHWPGGVWADTVYMAGEFLLRAGVALERAELVQEAVDQWLLHAELLQDPGSGLMAHGTHAGVRIDCYWGRANAWFALAGTDLLALGGDADSLDEVRQRLERQLRTLADLQPPHGVWDVLVDGQVEVRGVLETSAAAGIGAAMLRAAVLLDEALRAAGERAVLGALSYVDDGALTRASAGTILQLVPFGYSVIRDDRIQPWGQGLALEAVTAWRETHR